MASFINTPAVVTDITDTTATDTKAVATDTKAVATDTKAVAVATDTKAVATDTKAVATDTKAVATDTKTNSDNKDWEDGKIHEFMRISTIILRLAWSAFNLIADVILLGKFVCLDGGAIAISMGIFVFLAMVLFHADVISCCQTYYDCSLFVTCLPSLVFLFDDLPCLIITLVSLKFGSCELVLDAFEQSITAYLVKCLCAILQALSKLIISVYNTVVSYNIQQKECKDDEDQIRHKNYICVMNLIVQVMYSFLGLCMSFFAGYACYDFFNEIQTSRPDCLVNVTMAASDSFVNITTVAP